MATSKSETETEATCHHTASKCRHHNSLPRTVHSRYRCPAREKLCFGSLAERAGDPIESNLCQLHQSSTLIWVCWMATSKPETETEATCRHTASKCRHHNSLPRTVHSRYGCPAREKLCFGSLAERAGDPIESKLCQLHRSSTLIWVCWMATSKSETETEATITIKPKLCQSNLSRSRIWVLLDGNICTETEANWTRTK